MMEDVGSHHYFSDTSAGFSFPSAKLTRPHTGDEMLSLGSRQKAVTLGAVSILGRNRVFFTLS